MATFEIIHHIKTKCKTKFEYVALKVDISKANDRVDWGSLEDIMLKLRFGRRWVDFLMMRVKSVSYLVLINNNQVGPIIPGRGLRQGCPLSPYLLYYVLRD